MSYKAGTRCEGKGQYRSDLGISGATGKSLDSNGTAKLFHANKAQGDKPRVVPLDRGGVLTSRLGIEYDGNWVPMAAIFDNRITFLYAGTWAMKQATLFFRDIKDVRLEKRGLVPILSRSHHIKIVTRDDLEYILDLSSDEDEVSQIYHMILERI